MSRILKRAFLLSLLTLLWHQPVRAQDHQGFQVNRYEPTAAGEWSFWVDHPWYSSTRYFAGGITLNYAHNPLVFGTTSPGGSFMAQGSAIEHQLLGHVDLAGSFLDRVLVTVSLPVTLLETGTTQGRRESAVRGGHGGPAGRGVGADLRAAERGRVLGQRRGLCVGADQQLHQQLPAADRREWLAGDAQGGAGRVDRTA